MKRIIFALVLVGALAGTAFASAATLGVQGGTVQAGWDTSLSCQSNPVRVTAWGVNSATPGVNEGLDWATISGVEESCVGNDLVVELHTSAGPAYGGDYNASAAAGGASHATWSRIVTGQSDYKVAFHHDSSTAQRWFVPAETIEGIYIWIGGPVGPAN